MLSLAYTKTCFCLWCLMGILHNTKSHNAPSDTWNIIKQGGCQLAPGANRPRSPLHHLLIRTEPHTSSDLSFYLLTSNIHLTYLLWCLTSSERTPCLTSGIPEQAHTSSRTSSLQRSPLHISPSLPNISLNGHWHLVSPRVHLTSSRHVSLYPASPHLNTSPHPWYTSPLPFTPPYTSLLTTYLPQCSLTPCLTPDTPHLLPSHFHIPYLISSQHLASPTPQVTSHLTSNHFVHTSLSSLSCLTPHLNKPPNSNDTSSLQSSHHHLILPHLNWHLASPLAHLNKPPNSPDTSPLQSSHITLHTIPRTSPRLPSPCPLLSNSSPLTITMT